MIETLKIIRRQVALSFNKLTLNEKINGVVLLELVTNFELRTAFTMNQIHCTMVS